MSLSEIFDHGSPHPWANLRPNNVTVDGTLLSSNVTNFPVIPASPHTITVGTTPTFYQKLSGTVTSNATTLPIANNLIINFTPGVNTGLYVIYKLSGITQASGGTHPNTVPYQSAEYTLSFISGVFSAIGGNPRISDTAPMIIQGFGVGTAGCSCVLNNAIPNVVFSAFDNNGWDIVKWIYTFEIWCINQ
jgi:hypothetical protein